MGSMVTNQLRGYSLLEAIGCARMAREVNRLPTTRSAHKRMRQSRERNLRNRHYRSRVKSATRRFYQALESDENSAPDAYRQASRELDKAASKGAIHRNKAARKKSRLARELSSKES